MLDQDNAAPNTTNWARQRELFEAALELTGVDRTRFIEAQTTGEPELAQSLVELLAAHAKFAGNTDEQRQDLLTQASQLTEQAALGTQVGPYTLQSEIGRGGMGVVWLARRNDGTLDQTVAIKLLPPHRWDNASRARFNAERQIIAGLEHPGIARLLDAGEIQGQPYFVMEYVEGKSITDYATAKNLTTRERIALFQQVLDAIDYAHRQLVIHRDLKPSNILVSHTGNVKLIDFGIAKTLAVNANDTGTNQRFFSPSHAAPEQLTGKNIGVGVDIYQLGSVLYELLSGAPAFDFTDSNPAQIEAAIRSQPPKAPSKHNAGLSSELDAIILHCLKKAASERYANVHALAEDLRRVLTHRVISIRQGQGLYRARKFLRRNLAAVLASVAFLSLILGFGITNYRQAETVRTERDIAQTNQAQAQATSAFLSRVFSGSFSYVEWDADIKFVDVLNAAAKKVQTDLTLPAQSRTEIAISLAQSLLHLTDYVGSKSILDKIRDECQKLCTRRQSAIYSMVEAQLAIAQGDYKKGLPLIKNSVELMESSDARIEEKILFHANRMSALFANDQHYTTEEHAEEITAIWTKNSPLIGTENEARQALDISYIRISAYNRKNLDEKEKFLNSLLTQYKEQVKKPSQVLFTIHQTLGDIHYFKKDYKLSCNSLATAASIGNAIYGKDNEIMAKIYMNTASCARAQNNFAEAEASLKIAEKIVFKNNTPVPSQAAILNNLAMLYLEKTKEYPKAFEAIHRARIISEKLWGPSDTQTLLFRIREAIALREIGKLEESKKMLTLLESGFVTATSRVAILNLPLTRLQLAVVLLRSGDKKAARLMMRKIKMLDRSSLSEHAEVAAKELEGAFADEAKLLQ